jgi:hypothetical protein
MGGRMRGRGTRLLNNSWGQTVVVRGPTVVIIKVLYCWLVMDSGHLLVSGSFWLVSCMIRVIIIDRRLRESSLRCC